MAIYTYYTNEHRASSGSVNGNGTNFKPKLYVSVTSAAMALLLLAVMGIVLITTAIMLFFFSPLLLLLSPLLLLAGFVLAESLVGFGAAGAMAFGGVWSLRMGFGSSGGGGGEDEGYLMGRVAKETLTESRQRVVEEKEDFGGYSKRKVTIRPPDNGTVDVK